jgi:putative ABC transport system permease protein
MNLFTHALRELKNQKRFVLLFLLNLSLGLTGFVSLDLFKNSVRNSLEQRSKTILGADFGVSSRKPIKESTRNLIENSKLKPAEETQMIELFSMVSRSSAGSEKAKRTRLVQIKAIEKVYPFYGGLLLREQGQIKQSQQGDLFQKENAWVYPEILTQLGLEVGDSLKIGQAEFTISDVVVEDSAAGINSSMAPRIYISLDQLDRTRLIQPGSLAWFSRLYRFPETSFQELARLRDEVFQKIDNPEVEVYTHRNASDQLGRPIAYLSDFLGLTSLAALFLAAVGAGFLFRSYLQSKTRSIAILVSLGLRKGKALGIYLFQALSLGFLSAVIACIGSLFLLPMVLELSGSMLPFAVSIQAEWTTLLLALSLGTFGSALICLPLLLKIRSLRPNLLLSPIQAYPKSKLVEIFLSVLPGLIVFWLLSMWQANSVRIGSLFVLLFFTSGAILGFAVWIFFSAASRFAKVGSVPLRWALRDLSRLRLSTASCFLALGLGLVLLNIIPQLQSSLQQELQSPESSKLPSLFLFDIQETQVDGLKQLVREKDLSLGKVSPMVRARLRKVNGKAFDKGKGEGAETLTREEEREMRFRNRGFNLTYQKELSSSEEIYAGRPFSGVYDEDSQDTAEISVEYRFADRLNLDIGDVLEFSVEGVPVSGEIVNLRRVRWTSFQPNFFILFQKGVLEPAPKTFLASIEDAEFEEKLEFQDALVEKLPNVSVIDVTRLITRLQKTVSQMSWALQLMAIFTVIAGLVVLYSVANHQAQTRHFDMALLKALGSRFALIRKSFLWQFGLLSLGASLLGTAVSIGLGYGLSQLLFDGIWSIDWWSPVISSLILISLSLLITWFATQKVLKDSPAKLLEES